MALLLLLPGDMPLHHPRRIAAILVCVATVSGVASAQENVLRSLSPAAVEDLLASSTADAPAPLMVANRAVVTFRSTVIGRSAADRAAAAREVIMGLARDGARLEVTSRPLSTAAVISVGGHDVFAILPKDVDELRGETVEGLTSQTVERLQRSLDETIEARQPWVMIWAAVQAALGTLVFTLVVILLIRTHRRANLAVQRSADRGLTGVSGSREFARSSGLLHYVRRSLTALLTLTAIALAYPWLTFVLNRFPYTRAWGEALRGFLLARLSSLGDRIAGAIPDLFSVLLILIVTRLLIRIVQIVFAAIEEGRLQVLWIYPETAAPTRKLLIALLWMFALVSAYPYLPGAETEAFKGVSVFVGLMISLGSSGLINQIMSGLTLTYSRALRRGDFVRVGDVEGTVTYMGTLSTKIETPRREEVTIPNSVLVGQEVTNFTRNSEKGVFMTTELTIGYDAPWRKVESLLLKAAAATTGVRTEPAPFVLQKSLEDFYVRYALMVSLADPSKRAPTLDDLHANIQDAFNAEGVQIMSPNYEADPGEKKIVPKDQWYS
jgi:small-conductance mechanosensitive channel